MLNRKLLNKFTSLLLFSFILLIFISGFLILSNLYRLNTLNHKTVVLEDHLFSSTSTTPDRSNLQLESVLKLDTTYPIWNPGIVDDDTLVFQTSEKNRNKGKVYSLDLTTKTLDAIDDNNEMGMIVSPDGRKLLFSKADNGTLEAKTSLYDIQTEEIRKTFEGSPRQFAYDSNQYIGVSNNSVFIQNISTGEKEKLLLTTDFVDKNNRVPKLIQNLKIWNLTFSLDGTRLFYIGLYKSGMALYMLDLEKKNKVEQQVTGEITKVAPLSDGNLLLSGSIKGEEGIFLLDPEKKESKLILSGSIENFDTTPDGTIAYIIKNNKGVNNLHYAILTKDTIESDEMVYSDLKYLSFLKWSKSGKMLFCVSENINASSLYRFTFQSPA